MDKKENLSLILARRQKRLQFWRERFSTGKLDAAQTATCKQHFSDYSAEIAKMVHATEDSQRSASEVKLETLERQLTSLFESRRLMTSSIGVPSVAGE